MATLEELTRGTSIRGILPDGLVTVVAVKWIGTVAVEVTYKDSAGRLGSELLYRDREPTLEVAESGHPWSFDGDGGLFRLLSEAHRIRLAYLFDPLLAVHTSLVDPLPHQITAVYGEMLSRQPLRFLLADDPGAGKTIMTSLFIKELMARGDLQRCLIVCPGNLAEQWQDELDRRFHLPFDILTNDTEDDIDDLDDAPDAEVEAAEERVVDQASAARTIAELRAEIAQLQELERRALRVRQSGTDRKWDELSRLLQNNTEMFDAAGHRRKLVIFTEHRDTLNYPAEKIRALLGRPEAVVTIHGGVGREDRRKAQEAFMHDKEVEILVATDAAGEGINLQRAHLMVNYDLPWNPNRLEQRFGRIHRIGQTEVCHLWNLVARDTREGEVYQRLLEKLDEERGALRGQVFDVLGRLTFEDRSLRDLLLEAIRYGDQLEVKARLFQVVDHALDHKHLRELVEERALTHDSMDVTRVRQIRIVSKRLQFVEIDAEAKTSNAGPAPYLDYRPLTPEEAGAIQGLPSPDWMRNDLETRAMEHAAIHLVPQHLDEVRRRKEELIDKTRAAVQERLTKEITYWDHRAAQLKDQELAGRVNARLNSGLARQRADELTARLHKRLSELDQERKLSPLPPVVLGGALVVPVGLLRKLQGKEHSAPPDFALETEESERMAMAAVMASERSLGYLPRDVHAQKIGYDIESAIPGSGLLRFIEVKGRIRGAKTVTITKNEVLTGLNKPDEFILAICLIDGDKVEVFHVRTPFVREPDFGATSVNYDLNVLLAQGKEPS